jgi:hypothetical protein
MHKKIDVFIDGKYTFSTNRYKTLKECKDFLQSKSFIVYQSTYEKIIYLYDKKINVKFA